MKKPITSSASQQRIQDTIVHHGINGAPYCPLLVAHEPDMDGVPDAVKASLVSISVWGPPKLLAFP